MRCNKASDKSYVLPQNDVKTNGMYYFYDSLALNDQIAGSFYTPEVQEETNKELKPCSKTVNGVINECPGGILWNWTDMLIDMTI